MVAEDFDELSCWLRISNSVDYKFECKVLPRGKSWKRKKVSTSEQPYSSILAMFEFGGVTP